MFKEIDFEQTLNDLKWQYYCFTIDKFINNKKHYKKLLGKAKGIYCYFHNDEAKYVGLIEPDKKADLFSRIISEIEYNKSQKNEKWREIISDKNTVILIKVLNSEEYNYSYIKNYLINKLETYPPNGFNIKYKKI